MSNFQDTFTKHENTEDLQYDEFAFYFFSTTILSITLLFLITHIIKKINKLKKINMKNLDTCSCYTCQKKNLTNKIKA